MHIIKHLSILSLILFLACNNTSDFKTIKIGDQVWMTQNLNVDKFRNGDPIPEAKTKEEWQKAGENGQPAWCYYDNDPTNGKKYGKLYNWYAVNDPRGLAPKGWKIPSDEDWVMLIGSLGGNEVAGTKMKSTNGWQDDGNGTNESGFSVLPGGFCDYDGTFYNIGYYDYWWTSKKYNSTNALYLSLNYFGDVYSYYYAKGRGLSVRCLKETDYSESTTFNNNVSKEAAKSNEVEIGKQVWMAENLNVDTFRNGDPIPHAKTDEEWEKAGKNKQPAWCYFDNDPTNGKKYGKLYNWYAVNDPRGLAPKGWKIPSENDWLLLFNYLGGSREAGTKMKSTNGWVEDGNGTNESGFSGLPGGGRLYDGTLFTTGMGGYWWSSTENSSTSAWAWYLTLEYNTGHATWNVNDNESGFSVRCLRNRFGWQKSF